MYHQHITLESDVVIGTPSTDLPLDEIYYRAFIEREYAYTVCTVINQLLFGRIQIQVSVLYCMVLHSFIPIAPLEEFALIRFQLNQDICYRPYCRVLVLFALFPEFYHYALAARIKFNSCIKFTF